MHLFFCLHISKPTASVYCTSRTLKPFLFPCRKQFQHTGRALSHQGHGGGEQTLPLCRFSGPERELDSQMQYRSGQCQLHNVCDMRSAESMNSFMGTEAFKAQGSSEQRVKEFLQTTKFLFLCHYV